MTDPPPIPPRKKTQPTFAPADGPLPESSTATPMASAPHAEAAAAIAAAPAPPPQPPNLRALASGLTVLDWGRRPSAAPFFGTVPTPPPASLLSAKAAGAADAVAPPPPRPPPEQPTVVLGPAADSKPAGDTDLPIVVSEKPAPVAPVDRAGQSGNPVKISGVVPGEHAVVVHTVAGPLKRGILRDPDLDADRIDLGSPTGGMERIQVERVKAVFFMLAPGQDAPKPEGKRVTVNLSDGRQLFGFRKNASESERGFFLLPADSRTQAARIFVYRTAVKSIIER